MVAECRRLRGGVPRYRIDADKPAVNQQFSTALSAIATLRANAYPKYPEKFGHYGQLGR